MSSQVPASPGVRAAARSMGVLLLCVALLAEARAAALVLQSDFGLQDAAVAAMKGVAVSVSPDLPIFDATHEIPPYNIWEAALRLEQAAAYWPAGTVFVSVVDPGVGTGRRSVVMKSQSGHFFVTPDNGTLTFVADSLGVAEVREIDEAINRRQDSAASYTFHGRDVYAYTGARLAAGVIGFEAVGASRGQEIVRIPYQRASIEAGRISGTLAILDVRYGNAWTNIPRELLLQLHVDRGDPLRVRIVRAGEVVAELDLPYRKTFGEVARGDALLYINSLDQVALAVNEGNFAERYEVGSGPEWTVTLERPPD